MGRLIVLGLHFFVLIKLRSTCRLTPELITRCLIKGLQWVRKKKKKRAQIGEKWVRIGQKWHSVGKNGLKVKQKWLRLAQNGRKRAPNGRNDRKIGSRMHSPSFLQLAMSSGMSL